MIKNRPSIRAPKKARGAKKMAESDKIPQIDPSEIEVLIQKIEQNKLDERERRLIVPNQPPHPWVHLAAFAFYSRGYRNYRVAFRVA
jgi:hypothetical protein